MDPETPSTIVVRNTQRGDFPYIADICRRVYPKTPPWSERELDSHLHVFPEGQFVAVETTRGAVVGMDAALIIHWHDYDLHASWRKFTDNGMFTNHNPQHGRTMYAAEIMVDPDVQHHHVGSHLYEHRRNLVRRLGLLRIRGGSRLRGYGRHATELSPHDYVLEVVNGRLHDPTLSFQLHEGFHVFGVVSGYLDDDPESMGYAALIEWMNPDIAQPQHTEGRDPRFIKA